VSWNATEHPSKYRMLMYANRETEYHYHKKKTTLFSAFTILSTYLPVSSSESVEES